MLLLFLSEFQLGWDAHWTMMKLGLPAETLGKGEKVMQLLLHIILSFDSSVGKSVDLVVYPLLRTRLLLQLHILRLLGKTF